MRFDEIIRISREAEFERGPLLANYLPEKQGVALVRELGPRVSDSRPPSGFPTESLCWWQRLDV
jgi:hypothetical protein